MTSPLSSEQSVAVVIAAWRAARTVGSAVASALSQAEASEVIVVDDASNDGGATIEAARSADDGSQRLRIITLDRNGGPSAARNAALDAATAPWFCVLDSDDFMRPGRLAALLKESSKGYDLVADDLLQMETGADPATARPLWFRGAAEPQDINLEQFICANISQPGRPRGELGFIKPLIRRSLMDKHGIRYNTSMRLGEDFELYVRLLMATGSMRLIPATGYVSVNRPGSLSESRRIEDISAYVEADDQLLRRTELTLAQRKALQRHRDSLYRWIAWNDFAKAMKSGRIFQAGSIMLQGPQITRHVLGQLTRVAVGKVSSQRT